MSRVQIEVARSGEPTASLDGRYLHSRFDPRREADRFLERQAEEPRSIVIVLAPGLGYLYDSIRARRPGTRVIGCALLPEVSAGAVSRPDSLWVDGSGETIEGFLDRVMTDLDASTVSVVEWSPVADALPERAKWLRDSVAASISRAQASLVTQGASGRRWIRNTLHNYVHADAHAIDRTGTTCETAKCISAIAVVAAGPSLEESLERVRPYRDRIAIWSTASALDALAARGLAPDLIVATDAALYATEHLRDSLAGSQHGVPIAAPLSATRGLAGAGSLVVLAEGDALEQRLLAWPDTSVPAFPPHGTVTATALALARACTHAPILLLGADFGWRSSRSHVRPHLSHRYRDASATRLLPQESTVFAASAGHRHHGSWHTDRTLDTYAGWFNTTAHSRFSPISVLSPSPFVTNVPVADPDDLGALEPVHRPPAIAKLAWPPRRTRIERVTEVLGTFRARIADARPPQDRRLVADSEPELAFLGTRIALPALLRWYRSGDPEAWDELADEIVVELNQLMERYRVGL